MTDKEKIESLVILLDKAEHLVSEFRGGYSNQFFSAEEFHSALVESTKRLKAGDEEEISKLVSWFAPTCQWDDFTGRDGIDLGNSIYQLLYELKKSLKLYGIIELILDYQAAAAE